LKGDLPTGVASTFISPDGERTFGTFLGAASTLTAEDLHVEMFKGYDFLYIEGYLVQNHDLILHAAQLAREAGCQICIDLASYNVVAADLAFFDMLVTKYVDIVFANEEEAKAFTGKEADEAVADIAAKCSIAVVKVGARGSLVQKGSDCHHVQTPAVKRVVDTTGAGDFYAAGFMYGLMGGYSLDKCCRIGSLLASNVIQVIGTTLPKRRWDDIRQGIEEILQQEQ
jgi:sugar/nucleoside kinase (ribokinase family)